MQTHTLIDTVLREGDRFFKIYHVFITNAAWALMNLLGLGLVWPTED